MSEPLKFNKLFMSTLGVVVFREYHVWFDRRERAQLESVTSL
jgi:hypothetical protein